MRSAILLSGGPDSAVLAYERVKAGDDLVALTLNTGEAEGAAEKRCASEIARQLGIEHVFVDFTTPMRELYGKPQPMLMRMAQDWSGEVEPFGGGLALSLAASFALSRGAHKLYYGVHLGDSLYTDNNVEFFQHLSRAISIDRGFDFEIVTPHLADPKSELIRRGLRLGIDYAATWSCAANSIVQCGACAPCVERQVAFFEAHVQDPTVYEYPMSAEHVARRAGNPLEHLRDRN